MTLICDMLGSSDHLTNRPEIFYAFIALGGKYLLGGNISRGKNKWDFSFFGKSCFSFELINWNKYGIFAVIQIILFLALISSCTHFDNCLSAGFNAKLHQLEFIAAEINLHETISKT